MNLLDVFQIIFITVVVSIGLGFLVKVLMEKS